MTMVLVDTSVWIQHLRRGDESLISLLRDRQVLLHSCVLGELACGAIPQRERLLSDLRLLPTAAEARPEEVLLLVSEHKLYGKGLGWTDCQLLASSLISGSKLLTYDKRLASAFERLSI